MTNRTDLAFLLDGIVAFERRYVAMSGEQADAGALWAAHTYCIDAFDISPYLTISSAEMRSGKTTYMKLLELLVARPWRVITPSEAVVFRMIARDKPTILLDEYDTIFGDRDYEPLRAILNAGNEPGTTVPRCAGANRDRLEDFPIYCAKVLAGIGKLPATVADRSIEIRLKRKKRDENVERFRRRDVRAAAEPLHQALVSLAEHYADELAEARPDLPDDLDDRAQDCWEPLFAIADLAGGGWPERARRAALALSGRDARDDDSDGVRLLADIRDIFERRAVDPITSATLVDDLHEIEEAPWSEWYGKPISARGVAKILARYDIAPKPFRFGEQTLRGYKRASFEDAWARFLPSATATSATSASEQGFSEQTNRNTNGDVADAKEAANPHEQTDVADVADRNGGQTRLSAREEAVRRDRAARALLEMKEHEDRERDEQLAAEFGEDG